jgi:hypothetical protein
MSNVEKKRVMGGLFWVKSFVDGQLRDRASFFL